MKNSRVVVIDRDPVVQRAVEAGLVNQGCEVTAVGDGLSGLDIALAASPDMIFADYRMTGINVFRFLEKLKQKNVLKNAVLLLLINPGDSYDELTLRLAGISDFLSKPLKTEDMLERVQRFLPDPAPAPVTFDQPEPILAETDTVKIEHLLGWSPTAAESPFSELGDEHSGTFDLSVPGASVPSPAPNDVLLFTHQSEETPAETLSPDLDFGEGNIDAQFSAAPEHPAPFIGDPSDMTSIPESGPTSGASSDGTSVRASELVDRMTKDVVEKIAWEVVPHLAQRSIEQIVKAVVERIVWETVPVIAETAIKNEIERLKSEDAPPPQQSFSG